MAAVGAGKSDCDILLRMPEETTIQHLDFAVFDDGKC